MDFPVLIVLLPTILLYAAVAILAFLCLRYRSRLLLIALLIVSSPLWLFWPWAYARSAYAYHDWGKAIFFPEAPIAITRLTIAGDGTTTCQVPCVELLLNRRLEEIVLWSKKAPAGPPTIQAVTPNVTDECRSLIARDGLHNPEGRQKITDACFSYRPIETVPRGYLLFIGESRFFDLVPRRDPWFRASYLSRYQAFTKSKSGERLHEIAYSARIRVDYPAFPPALSLTGKFARGPHVDFGDLQDTRKIINRIFAVDLTGDVKL